MGHPLLDLLLLAVSVVLLWKGADWIVEAAGRIGRAIGLSDLVIGLTVVAFGTSAPEFAVTISAAIAGNGSIAAANVIGSNVFNLGLILGGAALFRALVTSRAASRRDGPILALVAISVAVVLWDGQLTRAEGAVLFTGLLAYLALLWRSRELPEPDAVPAGQATWLSGVRLLVGLAAVAGGGHLLVTAASSLALAIGVPEWLVGLTVVAAGTSASEAATSIVAVARGRNEMLVGNLVGSDIFNMLGVLGLAGLLRPFTSPGVSAWTLGSLWVTCGLAAWFLWSGGRLGRREGAVLVASGLLRWGYEFALG